MALGTATTIPIVLMFSAIQSYFIEGLTAGAVKG
jgi:ABC-type glycerol-3-phosphate transport system permease component